VFCRGQFVGSWGFMTIAHQATSRRSARASVAVSLLGTVALSLPAIASAKPATLRLSAVVYDVHSGQGEVITSKEKLSQGVGSVGEDSSRCTPVSKTTVHCTGSYKLTHGTLQIAGTIPRVANTNHLSVVGGTGAYKGARGTVVTEYNKPGTRAKETITFK
jgi:Dirigent-like protein